MGWGFSVYLSVFGGLCLYIAGAQTDPLGMSFIGYVCLAIGVFCLIAVVDHTRLLSNETHYLRKFLEKTRSEDPCDPTTELYKQIRRDVLPP